MQGPPTMQADSRLQTHGASVSTTKMMLCHPERLFSFCLLSVTTEHYYRITKLR